MHLTLVLTLALLAGPSERQLEDLSDDALLSCAGDAQKCDASEWDLARELARRLGPPELRARYLGARGAARRVLLFALYVVPPDAQTTKLMRARMRDHDEEVAYYALNYLAKQCDDDALRRLAAPPYTPRADCQQWATTVALFGECRYKPGVPFLVASLEHACLNVVTAALDSLKTLFPDSPSFSSAAEAKKYYATRSGTRHQSGK